MRRRSNPVAAKRKRLSHVAKIKREDPFRPEDTREIEQACRRIAAAGDWMSSAGWREDSGYCLFHFSTWAKARAMQHWIDRSSIARRPTPKLGLTAEEEASLDREALAWGLETGAVREVVQAYRRARHAGNSELTAFNDAAGKAMALGRPNEKVQRTTKVLIAWARAHHRDWFYKAER